MPVSLLTMPATSTADVVITSFLESCDVASSVTESMRLASAWLKHAIHVFTTMDSSSAATTASEKSVGSGFRIFWNEVFARSKPTTTMMNATMTPARYSMRPCP